MVRGTDGFIIPWNRNQIVEQLLTETKLAEEFYETRAINRQEAEDIAVEVEQKVFDLNLKAATVSTHQARGWFPFNVAHVLLHYSPA